MNRSRFAPIAASALALLLYAAPARATVLEPLDLRALVGHADRIALARVESQRARFTEGRGAIVTEVTLRVERAMKGPLATGDRVVVLREGGEVDGLGMRVAGAPRFRDGEDVVVFLERRGAATYTVGMTLGKLHVAVVDGRRVAMRELDGVAFTRPPPPEPRVRPLEELEREIAAAVRATGR